MDLHTIREIVRPNSRAQLPEWTAGDAWLAGGTWLFSEPQPTLSRLVDLNDLHWPALTVTDMGLEIAATCTIAELNAFASSSDAAVTHGRDWRALPLFEQCCRSFLASFKIWKTATVGGNICMSLPAGPMISLTSALDGVCTIWSPNAMERQVSIVDFVTASQRNVLAKGELLRSITLRAAALKRRTAFRQLSLAPLGRSGVLVIGTSAADVPLTVTVTASTIRPIQLAFDVPPSPATLRERIVNDIPSSHYHTDVHGDPVWRRHMTLRLAEEIRAELEERAP
jgi:CO/xanthine dehydrogenase FAD-binding subunit